MPEYGTMPKPSAAEVGARTVQPAAGAEKGAFAARLGKYLSLLNSYLKAVYAAFGQQNSLYFDV